MELDPILDTALNAAIQAGAMILEAAQEGKIVNSKENPQDLVTKTDKAVEAFLFSFLKDKFPSHKFVGEESASNGSPIGNLSDTPTWVHLTFSYLDH